MDSQESFLTNLKLDDLDILEELAIREARESFWAFRQYINPKLKIGWFHRVLAKALQNFHSELIGGKRPVLIIEAPPQHGKSWAVIEFIAWLAGKDPDRSTIYASFSDRLGVRANLTLQRILESEKYKKCFPDTTISSNKKSELTTKTQSVFGYLGKDGGFRNTTVMGSVTGEGLGLGVMDDLIKGREQANSQLIRDKTWDWLTDDYYSRFSDDAGFISIATRWHIDDPQGRLRDKFPNAKIISFPAIAEKGEKYRKAGESLFPELKSLEFLLLRQSLMKKTSWNSLYQQNPTIEEGEFFAVNQFKVILGRPPAPIKMSVRYWDKGGTEGGGDYTSGTLMHILTNGQFYVEDVIRGQWSALNREQMIYDTALRDGKKVRVRYEQEPGSGGKESAEATTRMLRGFNAKAEKVNTNKEARAENYSCQVEIGNVLLKQAEWNKDFIDEHRYFPNGKNDDQIDSTSGAFAELENNAPNYNHMERMVQM